MQEIMKKVNELFDTLVAKNVEADALAKKQNATAKQQEAIAVIQAEKDTDLKGREEKVAKVENVLEIKRKSDDTLHKIMQEKESLGVAIGAHKTQAAKDKNDIVIREQGIKDDFKTLKEREAKLAEDQKKLKEDRENMKKDILERIAKGVK